MSEFTSSCDGGWPLADGTMVNLVVQTNNEAYFSRIYRVSNLGLPGGSAKEELLLSENWIMGLWCDSSPNILATDEDGSVHHLLGGTWTIRAVSDRSLTAVWGFNHDHAYAVGDAGVVYRWDGHEWSAISKPLGQKLFAVHGTSADSLYVCGNNGALWHWNGSSWTKIELGTNVRLLGLHAASPQEVWVCGARGSLHKGRGDDWQNLTGLTATDLHDVTVFQGKVHLAAATDGVLRIDDDVPTIIKNTVISYHLKVQGGFLVSCGDRIAIRYDGTAWAGLRYD